MGVLVGKRTVVTGAAQGIGAAIVQEFAEQDASVLALDRQWQAQPREGVDAVTIDVADDEQVQRLIADRSAIDVLVNCVGTVDTGSILDCDAATLDRAFSVNVMTMHHMIRAVLPNMLAAKRGAIVNIASVVSTTKAAPLRYAYATTKAAVLGLTRAVARDFIDKGIRCNSISPGTVYSPSLQQRLAATGDYDAALAAFTARQPMGRIGHAAEIAAAAVLLASDAAAFMSGSDIVIDGGMSL